jgi:hypothetical protein
MRKYLAYFISFSKILLEYIFRRITGLAENRYVIFFTPKMEAERPFHTTINFYRKHDFITEKTVLFSHNPHTRKEIKHTV